MLLSQPGIIGYVQPFMMGSESTERGQNPEQLGASKPALSPRRIHRLSDEVINQIAAGEVVERPASALKEILENSLDAGATRIEVYLEEGGLSLISVLDNGSGIATEDLPLAIERHATSKLQAVNDLESIASFGFRGEALSSIASVSELEIKTRTQDAETGNLLNVQFGMPSEIRSVGCRVGTQISIRNLFGRVPARLKFLRTSATENSHCLRVIREMALGNPSVSFFVHHNGKAVAKYTTSTRSKRLKEVMKPDWTACHFQDSFEDMHFEAHLSPGECLQDRGELNLFVNGRCVKNRLILSSIRNSYLETFGPHHDPSGAFYLDMRTDWVDVNVHPQKLEVRFFKQERIYGWILASLRKQLGKIARTNESYAATFKSPERQQAPFVNTKQPLPLIPNDALVESRFLGRTSNDYFLFESGSGLHILNKHGVLERKYLSDLKLGKKDGALATRLLDLPLLLNLNEKLYHWVAENLDFLKSVGLECECFGGRDVSIKSLPSLLRDDQCLNLLEGWLHKKEGERLDANAFIAHFACFLAQNSSQSQFSLNDFAKFSLTDSLSCALGENQAFTIDWNQIRKHYKS